MRALVVAAFVFVSLIPSVARAESACSAFSGQDVHVFGCLDLPTNGSVLVQKGSIALQGWALSCFTGMQPASAQLWYWLPPDADGKRVYATVDQRDWTISWRGNRPDVQAVFQASCSARVPYFGYTVWVRSDALPLGANSLSLVFTDPSLGYGTSIQSIWFTLVSGDK